MLFLKKTFMGLGALLLILWGGAGTQSNSTLLQGGGFLVLIVGLIVLYIFARMAWRAMGCLPSILIIFGILVFIVYAIGGFNNGINNVIPTLRSFLGQQPEIKHSAEVSDGMELMGEEDLYYEDEEDGEEDAAPLQKEPEKPATFQRLLGNLSGKSQEPQPVVDMSSLPLISGRVSVVTGDTLRMKGRYVRLYGVDAPEIDQTCANRSGRSYHCGKTAARWLSDWLINADADVDCRVMQQDKKGNVVATCALGPYDIGAALATAGWAVADIKYTDIYVPYEQEAQRERVGLWQGRFYKPWDWRKIKAQKPKIKIKKPKTKKSFWD